VAYTIMLRWDGLDAPLQEGWLDARTLCPEQCTYSAARRHGTSLQVTQTWRTLEAHTRFLSEVMTPALAAVGVTQAPQAVAFEISDLFLPRPGVRLPEPRASHAPAADLTAH
jgi:hypothetical protein